MAVKCCRCGVKLREPGDRLTVESARTLANRPVERVVCAACKTRDAILDVATVERSGRKERTG